MITKSQGPEVVAHASFSISNGLTRTVRDRLQIAQEAVSQEAGCLSYRFSQDILVPELIYVTERWRDQSAFQAHVGNEDSAAFVAFLEANGLSDFKVDVYEVVPSPS